MRDSVSSRIREFLESRLKKNALPSASSTDVDMLDVQSTDCSTIIHRIPLFVLSDILLPFLTIRDIGNSQMCSRSLRRLVEETCELTATMYINRSMESGTPLRVGSFVNRVPFSIPFKADVTKPIKCCRNLSIVCSLVHFGPLLIQQRENIRHDYIHSLQGSPTLGPYLFLDEHMRASVVDWMVEVSVEFSFAPSILHSAVQLVDVVLSVLPIPRDYFQLLGCVSLLVRSRSQAPDARGLGHVVSMTDIDVVYMCDSQYTLLEVQEMACVLTRHQHEGTALSSSRPSTDRAMTDPVGIDTYHHLASNPSALLPGLNTSSRPTALSFLAPLCALLHLPLIMYQQLEVEMPAYMSYAIGEIAPTPSAAEHVLLAIFLADLSLLDVHMLKYSPFTVSCAVMCLARLTLHHYATSQLLLTPYGVADGKSRELKQLIRYDATQHTIA